MYSSTVAVVAGANQGSNEHPSFAVHVQNGRAGKRQIQVPAFMIILKGMSSGETRQKYDEFTNLIVDAVETAKTSKCAGEGGG
jgi:hypothetical protein